MGRDIQKVDRLYGGDMVSGKWIVIILPRAKIFFQGIVSYLLRRWGYTEHERMICCIVM
jgi:hypothetical protein